MNVCFYNITNRNRLETQFRIITQSFEIQMSVQNELWKGPA